MHPFLHHQNVRKGRPRSMLPVGLLVATVCLWRNFALLGSTAPYSPSTLAERRQLGATTIQFYNSPLVPKGYLDSGSGTEEKKSPYKEQLEEYDAFDTPSVRCRMGIEQWQNDNIDQWVNHPPYPMVEWIWQLSDPITKHKYYKGLFNILQDNGRNSNSGHAGYLKDLAWEWQDQYGNNYTIAGFNRAGLKQVRLYFRLDPPRIQGLAANPIVPKRMWPSLPNGTIPIVYDLEPYIHCNQIEQNHPPPPEVKIGACITRFWGQHDLMPEWIAYHRMIGIQHFWFFVSEPFDNIYHSMPRYEKDITFIPYNYTWKGHRQRHNINASHYGGENWFQPAANNQCLYMAKQYGLDWVLTPDVDEYVAILDPPIAHFQSTPPLQQYLQKYHDLTTNPNLGEVCLHGAGWGRHPNQQENTTEQLTIDFVYRRDRKLGSGEGSYDGKGAGGRKKCFYNAQVVKDVLIHQKVQGGTSVVANTNQIELYHFRSPLLGPQETSTKDVVAYPELRDMYREKIASELRKNNWTFPNLTAHVDEGYSSLSV